eukprot:TRINITY_DN335_c0_g1_i2.p1 TRINITY_DN335_c0_g1~~TRINITY_DN335_c0_g1_i2.p1  ORF type:complete len:233 (+),score=28.41 TRINITY_DN335_c0_g1_i2:345-1043(+)
MNASIFMPIICVFPFSAGGEPRDSLSFRERLGKPGSRRYQRWVNDFFVLELNRSLSDLEDEIEWIEDDDWYFNTTPQPPLRRLLGDEASFKLFESLLNVTEEQQQYALHQIGVSDRSDHYEATSNQRLPSLSPDQAFGQLSKPIRKFLKQYCNTEMCHEVDRCLRELLISEAEEAHFFWRDPFQRKLAHALSRYYCMTSYSKDAQDGRVTVVAKTGQLVFPIVSVADYLIVE